MPVPNQTLEEYRRRQEQVRGTTGPIFDRQQTGAGRYMLDPSAENAATLSEQDVAVISRLRSLQVDKSNLSTLRGDDEVLRTVEMMANAQLAEVFDEAAGGQGVHLQPETISRLLLAPGVGDQTYEQFFQTIVNLNQTVHANTVLEQWDTTRSKAEKFRLWEGYSDVEREIIRRHGRQVPSSNMFLRGAEYVRDYAVAPLYRLMGKPVSAVFRGVQIPIDTLNQLSSGATAVGLREGTIEDPEVEALANENRIESIAGDDGEVPTQMLGPTMQADPQTGGAVSSLGFSPESQQTAFQQGAYYIDTFRRLLRIDRWSEYWSAAGSQYGTSLGRFRPAAVERVTAQYDLDDDTLQWMSKVAEQLDSHAVQRALNTGDPDEMMGLWQTALEEATTDIAPGVDRQSQEMRSVVYGSMLQNTDAMAATFELAAGGRISPGAMAALRAGYDPASPLYGRMSGQGDALNQIVMDPLNLVGGGAAKSLKALRYGIKHTDNALNSARILGVLRSRRVRSTTDDVMQAVNEHLVENLDRTVGERLSTLVDGELVRPTFEEAASPLEIGAERVARRQPLFNDAYTEIYRFVENRLATTIRNADATQALEEGVIYGERIVPSAVTVNRWNPFRRTSLRGLDDAAEDGGSVGYLVSNDGSTITRGLTTERAPLMRRGEDGVWRLDRDFFDAETLNYWLLQPNSQIAFRQGRMAGVLNKRPLVPHDSLVSLLPKMVKRGSALVIDHLDGSAWRHAQKLEARGLVGSAQEVGVVGSGTVGRFRKVRAAVLEETGDARTALVEGIRATNPVTFVGNFLASVTRAGAQGVLHVNRPTSPTVFRDMMSVLPAEMRGRWFNAYTSAQGGGERIMLTRHVIAEMVSMMGVDHSASGKRFADEILRQFDEMNGIHRGEEMFGAVDPRTGERLDLIVDPASGREMAAAVGVADLARAVSIPDVRQIMRYGRFSSMWDALGSPIEFLYTNQAMDVFHSRVWNPAVLFKLSFPWRVVSDEVLSLFMREGMFETLSAGMAFSNVQKRHIVPRLLRVDRPAARLAFKRLIDNQPLEEYVKAMQGAGYDVDRVMGSEHFRRLLLQMDEARNHPERADRIVKDMEESGDFGTVARLVQQIDDFVRKSSPYELLALMHADSTSRIVKATIALHESGRRTSEAVRRGLRALNANEMVNDLEVMFAEQGANGNVIPLQELMASWERGAFHNVALTTSANTTRGRIRDPLNPHTMTVQMLGYELRHLDEGQVAHSPQAVFMMQNLYERRMYDPVYRTISRTWVDNINQWRNEGLSEEEILERMTDVVAAALKEDEDYLEAKSLFQRLVTVDGRTVIDDTRFPVMQNLSRQPRRLRGEPIGWSTTEDGTLLTPAQYADEDDGPGRMTRMWLGFLNDDLTDFELVRRTRPESVANDLRRFDANGEHRLIISEDLIDPATRGYVHDLLWSDVYEQWVSKYGQDIADEIFVDKMHVYVQGPDGSLYPAPVSRDIPGDAVLPDVIEQEDLADLSMLAARVNEWAVTGIFSRHHPQFHARTDWAARRSVRAAFETIGVDLDSITFRDTLVEHLSDQRVLSALADNVDEFQRYFDNLDLMTLNEHWERLTKDLPFRQSIVRRHPSTDTELIALAEGFAERLGLDSDVFQLTPLHILALHSPLDVTSLEQITSSEHLALARWEHLAGIYGPRIPPELEIAYRADAITGEMTQGQMWENARQWHIDNSSRAFLPYLFLERDDVTGRLRDPTGTAARSMRAWAEKIVTEDLNTFEPQHERDVRWAMDIFDELRDNEMWWATSGRVTPAALLSSNDQLAELFGESMNDLALRALDELGYLQNRWIDFDIDELANLDDRLRGEMVGEIGDMLRSMGDEEFVAFELELMRAASEDGGDLSTLYDPQFTQLLRAMRDVRGKSHGRDLASRLPDTIRMLDQIREADPTNPQVLREVSDYVSWQADRVRQFFPEAMPDLMMPLDPLSNVVPRRQIPTEDDLAQGLGAHFGWGGEYAWEPRPDQVNQRIRGHLLDDAPVEQAQLPAGGPVQMRRGDQFVVDTRYLWDDYSEGLQYLRGQDEVYFEESRNIAEVLNQQGVDVDELWQWFEDNGGPSMYERWLKAHHLAHRYLDEVDMRAAATTLHGRARGETTVMGMRSLKPAEFSDEVDANNMAFALLEMPFGDRAQVGPMLIDPRKQGLKAHRAVGTTPPVPGRAPFKTDDLSDMYVPMSTAERKHARTAVDIWRTEFLADPFEAAELWHLGKLDHDGSTAGKAVGVLEVDDNGTVTDITVLPFMDRGLIGYDDLLVPMGMEDESLHIGRNVREYPNGVVHAKPIRRKHWSELEEIIEQSVLPDLRAELAERYRIQYDVREPTTMNELFKVVAEMRKDDPAYAKALVEAVNNKFEKTVTDGQLRAAWHRLADDGGRDVHTPTASIGDELIDTMVARADDPMHATWVASEDELSEVARSRMMPLQTYSTRFLRGRKGDTPLDLTEQVIGDVVNRAFEPLGEWADWISREKMLAHYYTQAAADFREQIRQGIAEWARTMPDARWDDALRSPNIQMKLDAFGLTSSRIITDAGDGSTWASSRVLRDRLFEYKQEFLDADLTADFDLLRDSVNEMVYDRWGIEWSVPDWLVYAISEDRHVRQLIDALPEVVQYGKVEGYPLYSAGGTLFSDNDLGVLLDDVVDHAIGMESRIHAAAMTSAANKITTFADVENTGSLFAQRWRNAFPFWWATERFYKRLAATTAHSPLTLRRMQLTYKGLESAGWFQEDGNGNKLFVYPFSGMMNEKMARIIGLITGGDYYIPVDTQVGTQLRWTVPGIDEGGGPRHGPVSAFAIGQLAARFPESELFSTLEENLLDDMSGDPLRTASDIFLPSSLRGMWQAVFGSPDRFYGQLFNAAAHMEAAGLTPPQNASDEELQRYEDRLRNWTRILAIEQSMWSFVGLGPAQVHVEGSELYEEFRDLSIRFGPENAISEFMRRHPDESWFTLYATSTTSGGPIQATEQTWLHLREHEQFFRSYRRAAAWFMPDLPSQVLDSDQEWHSRSFAEQRDMGLRLRASEEGGADYVDDILRDVYFQSTASHYFDRRDYWDTLISDASGTPYATDLRHMKSTELDWIKNQNPIFKTQLEGMSGDSVEPMLKATRNAMDAVWGTEDTEPIYPELQNERSATVKTVLDAYVAYREWDDSYRNYEQRAEISPMIEQGRIDFLRWGTQQVAEHPEYLSAFWNAIILEDMGITSQAEAYDTMGVATLGELYTGEGLPDDEEVQP